MVVGGAGTVAADCTLALASGRWNDIFGGADRILAAPPSAPLMKLRDAAAVRASMDVMTGPKEMGDGETSGGDAGVSLTGMAQGCVGGGVGNPESNLRGDSVRCESKVPSKVLPSPLGRTTMLPWPRPAASAPTSDLLGLPAEILRGGTTPASKMSVAAVSHRLRRSLARFVMDNCNCCTSKPSLRIPRSMAASEPCTVSMRFPVLSTSWRKSFTMSSNPCVRAWVCITWRSIACVRIRASSSIWDRTPAICCSTAATKLEVFSSSLLATWCSATSCSWRTSCTKQVSEAAASSTFLPGSDSSIESKRRKTRL